MNNFREELVFHFNAIEEKLKQIRHVNNVVEITESYKKLKELGLWVTLAMNVNPPQLVQNPKQPREDIKFANKKRQVVANTK